MRPKVIVHCLALSVLTAGCATEKASVTPQDLPAAFDNVPAQSTAAAWPSQDWYRGFSSDELNGLIDEASKSNWDLAGARARVAQAGARARIAGAAIYPTLNGVGTANFFSGHSSQGSGHELDWSAMLSASYEIDFWGKNKATAQSGAMLALASRSDLDTVALTTLAGVANGYFQIVGLRERMAIAEQNKDTAKQLLGVVQSRYDAGVATPVELATQQAAFDSAQIAIVDLDQLISDGQAALALLLGRAPEKFEVKGVPLDQLTEPTVAAGIPSELLTRRPDIASAEANLRASHADLIVARAAMFPSLSLTAGAGVANPVLPATILTIGGIGPSFNLGANILQPIFDHGKLKAQRDEVIAKDQELLAVYHTAILAALVDVENSLSAIQHLDSSKKFQDDNVAQSERAFEGAQARYKAGSGDFVLMLDAQRTLYVARDQYVQYRLARLTALVGLAKALGGGWTQQAGYTMTTDTKNGI